MTAIQSGERAHDARSRTVGEPIDETVTLAGSGWTRAVDWHNATMLGTPAFWVDQARRAPKADSYQVGETLLDEIAQCLLGGYGIREQVAYAAFARVRERGLLAPESPVSEEGFVAALSSPLSVRGHSKPIRYRFPHQKAQRLAGAIRHFRAEAPPPESEARALRDWLTRLPGVGLKTASWIVRNRLRSDEVAVIDIHIRRAGVAAGCFDPAWRLPRDYYRFEEAFVDWARIGDVPTADLDAYIWSSLSALGAGARAIFGVERLSDLD